MSSNINPLLQPLNPHRWVYHQGLNLFKFYKLPQNFEFSKFIPDAPPSFQILEKSLPNESQYWQNLLNWQIKTFSLYFWSWGNLNNFNKICGDRNFIVDFPVIRIIASLIAMLIPKCFGL